MAGTTYFQKEFRDIYCIMGQINESERYCSSVKGLASHLLEEVIKADMSMHEAQIEAWRKFGEYRPKGDYVNPDIHLGFAEKQYLCLNELRFSFHIECMPLNFINRIKLLFRILTGKSSLALHEPAVFDFCSPRNRKAMPMEIVVKRFENGNVRAEYKPVDNVTGELLETNDQ